jgi:outer membrane lipoprotein carrier protein
MCHVSLSLPWETVKIILRRISSIFLPIAAGILIGLWLFPGAVLSTESLPLRDLIETIQKRYEKTADLKARFFQEVVIKAMKKTEKEDGILYIKNPRKMFWHYQNPSVKKLIINPRNAWLYVPEDKVVYIQDAEAVLKSKLIINFLSGTGKLSEGFNVDFSENGPVDEEGNYLITLIPKVPDFGVDKLFVTVDKKTFLIVQISFSDVYGNTTRIRFDNIQTNTNLSDQMFEFKTPAGVEVFNVP